jgi:hypothetical protein
MLEQMRIGVERWMKVDELCIAAAFGATYVQRLAACDNVFLRGAAEKLMSSRAGCVCVVADTPADSKMVYATCIAIGHRIAKLGGVDIRYTHFRSAHLRLSEAPKVELQVGEALNWRFGPLLPVY